jgi:hypothetical protein
VEPEPGSRRLSPRASTGWPSISASTRSIGSPDGERTVKLTSMESPLNLPSAVGETIVTTGGSAAATEAVSSLRLAVSLARLTASAQTS